MKNEVGKVECSKMCVYAEKCMLVPPKVIADEFSIGTRSWNISCSFVILLWSYFPPSSFIVILR